MARNVRTYIGDSQTPPALTPKRLTKMEFGKRLYQLMVSKGWHQSELARRSEVSRDSISTYIRGKSLPEAENVQKLAAALGIDPFDLLPNFVENAIDQDMPSLEMKISTNDTRVAWLSVNRLVSVGTCVKIVELLNSDKLPEKQ